MAQHIEAAWGARQGLHDDLSTTAYRVFHGYHEGCPGLEIDLFGDVAIVSSKGAGDGAMEEAARCLQRLRSFAAIVGKEKGRPIRTLAGEMPQRVVTVAELGLQYGIEPWAPTNPGLYIDARPARQWLQDNSEGRRILNLFSFAGSLGVAAMAGGASSVTHVDTQKRALARCVENHRRNQQAIDARDVVRKDVKQYLRLPGTARRRFGGIILDPPPGIAGDLTVDGLAGPCASLLAPGGWLLCFFHHDKRSWGELEESVLIRAQTREVELSPLWRGQSGADFPEEEERQTLRLSVFLRQ